MAMYLDAAQMSVASGNAEENVMIRKKYNQHDFQFCFVLDW